MEVSWRGIRRDSSTCKSSFEMDSSCRLCLSLRSVIFNSKGHVSVVASATIKLIYALSVVRHVAIFTCRSMTISLVCFSSPLFALLARTIRVLIGAVSSCHRQPHIVMHCLVSVGALAIWDGAGDCCSAVVAGMICCFFDGVKRLTTFKADTGSIGVRVARLSTMLFEITTSIAGVKITIISPTRLRWRPSGIITRSIPL